MDSISPWVAFIGGVLSLLTPCVLPMLPVYLGSLGGGDILETGAPGHRLNVFLRSLSFVLGFSSIFILLGTLAGLIGFTLSSHLNLVRWVSGSFMILFGLFLFLATKMNRMNFEKRISIKYEGFRGHWRAFIIGIIFALAWTPCVGPVLGGILSLALNSESAWQGSYLLVFYSIGMALPFLIIGLASDLVLPLIKSVSRYAVYLSFISGLLLVGVGVLILLDKLSWFSF